MNPLTSILLRLLIAGGNELLTEEAPLLKELGGAVVSLGEDALGILGDGTIPTEQKKALWQQELDVMNAIWARCKDEVPSLINTLINSIATLGFEALVGMV